MITFEKGIFSLENSRFSRKMQLDADGLRTVSCTLDGHEFSVVSDVLDFSFTVNGISCSGYAPGAQKLTYSGHEIKKGAKGAEILEITFDLPGALGRAVIVSTVYPDLPGAIRSIRFEAAGKAELELSQLIIDTFNLAPRNYVNVQIFREQGRIPALPQFTITGSDDMLRFHDAGAEMGCFTGSAIPGSLRYVMCYPHWDTGARYGYSFSTPLFKKYIAPGESWESAEVYFVLYKGSLEDCGGRNDFREMVRRSMPELTSVAGPMYCTWIPFLKDISESLISDIAGVAREVGFDILVLDDGWFVDGKWQVDTEKFPNGLEAVAADLRKKDLKFGLWFNIGTDYGDVGSRSETNCLMENGKMKMSGETAIRCFGSDHVEHISDKLESLAKEYGLAYFKMDFSNILSPYGVLPSGCYARNHRHRNGEDAVIEQYAGLYAVRQNLKKRMPDLCLDYSFEVFGTEFPGVAGLQYSDIQHVSNLSTDEKFYDVRMVREAIYAFTAMLPPERVSGSLIELQHGEAVEALYTSMAGNPLMAGDLRTLDAAERASAKNIFASFKRISASGALTEMQTWRDTRNSDDPACSCDGYFRWSRESGNGIAAVFANNSGVSSQMVKFPVPGEESWTLTDMETLKVFGKFSGSQLKSGVEIPLEGRKVRGFTLEKA